MSIKVKAVERNVSFDKNVEKWAYVMQAELYSKLSQSKVIQEASLCGGILVSFTPNVDIKSELVRTGIFFYSSYKSSNCISA